MQAYEFLARPTNGTISIPNELRHIITSDIRVIILDVRHPQSNDSSSITRKSDLALPPTLDTRGWKFDREEANER